MSVIYPIKSDENEQESQAVEEEEAKENMIKIKIKVPAGEDNIVILRRAREENVKYSLKYLTHAPELTDE